MKDNISNSVEHNEKYIEQDDYLDVFEDIVEIEMLIDPSIENSSHTYNTSVLPSLIRM